MPSVRSILNLIRHLTEGQVHATDVTNAARTSLYDISRGARDEDLCRLFDVPTALLPDLCNGAADFDTAAPSLYGDEAPPARWAV